jgi:hypothetical protein
MFYFDSAAKNIYTLPTVVLIAWIFKICALLSEDIVTIVVSIRCYASSYVEYAATWSTLPCSGDTILSGD